ncbi:hypothetical protein ABVT39_009454 [Epinephelus coioides]
MGRGVKDRAAGYRESEAGLVEDQGEAAGPSGIESGDHQAQDSPNSSDTEAVPAASPADGPATGSSYGPATAPAAAAARGRAPNEPNQLTPKGSEELQLAHAGLGKRLLTLPDNLKHNEIVALLEEQYPKLKTLKGGWMFFKSTGGSGRRKLSIIPTDSEGYATRLLKSASNNGKNTVFVLPLQEMLSTEPLPYDSVEFAKMPQSQCITCGSQMPLQLLPLHVEGCRGTLPESESGPCLDEDCSVIEQPVPCTTGMEESLAVGRAISEGCHASVIPRGKNK